MPMQFILENTHHILLKLVRENNINLTQNFFRYPSAKWKHCHFNKIGNAALWLVANWLLNETLQLIAQDCPQSPGAKQ